ncbi:type I restriction modification DNA specificity domain-containing protein [Campylobacter jejuni subsp. doylei]|nr:type I restriction modification DNA specificity domain-containing protein [Campylobacter jejuni subsp. doylei]
MNKIEKLLNELCPNGVEFLPIASVIKRVRNKVKDKAVEVYSVSNTLGLIKSTEMRDRQIHSKEIANYTIILKGQFAYNPARLNIGSFAYLKDEIGAVSPMYVVFSIDECRITQQFLFYYVKSPRILQKIISLTEEGARFRFDFERWEKIQIPIPPLEIQEEIVKILDAFTELEAELEARRRQYEYYRNKLLSFEYLKTNGGGV